MLRLAGELADGTVTTWTGPATLADRVVPALTRAAATAGRPAPRVVANLPVCVTADEAAARRFVAERYGAAADMPSYRAMLDAEGTDLPGVVVAGDEAAVERHLGRLADAGATEFVASPFGTPEDCARTVAFLADLASRPPYVKKPSERRAG
jgi:alkanesulfonate monooxygenase SsuD/methylene tetrahydromethanopterin reductase-like flavin-dependent oxidoreductase (luciferase family)